MLTILGRKEQQSTTCDGVCRRGFLQIGALGFGGIALPQLLRAEAAAGIRNSHKAVINILLPGGPPHQDMFDLKPMAPVEIRGELQPIRTNVSGIEICELMPRVAKMMDKFVIIRSMADSNLGHDLYKCVTGYSRNKRVAVGGTPSVGAWISRLTDPVTKAVPSHMSLMYPTGEKRWGDPGNGGFLGMAHSPFRLVSGNRMITVTTDDAESPTVRITVSPHGRSVARSPKERSLEAARKRAASAKTRASRKTGQGAKASSKETKTSPAG